MTINIQKLIDELNTRASLADSNTSTNEMLKLNHAVLRLNNTTGVIEATAKSSLPVPVDSAMLGNIAFVSRGPDTDSAGIGNYADSHGGYYMARTIGNTIDSCWSRLRLPADSDAENTEPSASFAFGGTISGYSAGGQQPALSNIIEKYSFVSDANATDVGDLPQARYSQQGVQSSTAGYVMGGRGPNANSERGIHKVTFASDTVGNSTNVLSIGRQQLATNGVVSSSHGYAVGGAGASQAADETIDKFPFASETNATDVGDLLVGTADRASCHSDVTNGYGYTAGGENAYGVNPPGTGTLKLIQKFSTSSDGNAVDAIAELQFAKRRVGSNTSSSYGYITGGGRSTSGNPPLTNFINEIDKFAFNSEAQSADVGDLTNGILRPGSSSSTASGYTHGGYQVSGGMSNVIQKFPFSTDANATDVGDLTAAASNSAGLQV